MVHRPARVHRRGILALRCRQPAVTRREIASPIAQTILGRFIERCEHLLELCLILRDRL